MNLDYTMSAEINCGDYHETNPTDSHGKSETASNWLTIAWDLIVSMSPLAEPSVCATYGNNVCYDGVVESVDKNGCEGT